MFSNLEELRELIKQGKTNAEIISERLNYLETNNNSHLEPIFNGSQAIFYNGFINCKTLISSDDGYTDEVLYMADTVDLYNELIDTIRKNIDKKGIPIRIIIQKVWNYFSENENSQYGELIHFIKEFLHDDKYAARTWMPYIINDYYNCSNYNGNITDFGKAFMFSRHGNETTKKKYASEIEKYRSSIDWKKAKMTNTCKLSTLKGAGIAACTEKSIALQNCLTFLGFDSYLIAGKISDEQAEEEHNFNVVRGSNGIYKIVDAAQASIISLENISQPEDLLYLDGITGINGRGRTVTYSSYYAKKQKNR